jgi:two-component system cell cycle response regulator
MSLQRRLTLFFVLIVILPLALAGFAVQRIVVGEITRRAAVALGPALDNSVIVYEERLRAADDNHARSIVSPTRLARLMQGSGKQRVEGYLLSRLAKTSTIDFFALVDATGDLLGFARRVPPKLLQGVSAPTPREIVRSGPNIGRAFVRTISIPLMSEGKEVGRLIGGFWLDGELLAASPQDDVHVSLLAGNRVIASTAPLERPVTVDIQPGQITDIDLNGEVRAEARQFQGDISMLASTSTSPITALSRSVLVSVLGLLAVVLIGTSILAWVLSKLITQPLEELSQGARAIATGDLDYEIPVRSHDEVGRLAASFNEMTGHLRDTIGQLQYSRDQLQRAVRRVGETLRSTHDMGQLRESILNTAADAVGADAAVMWLFTPTRDELFPAIVRGIDGDLKGRLKVGEGIAGLVAERATTVLLPADGRGPKRGRREPHFPVLIGVPLYTQDRVSGVLVVGRKDPHRRFTDEDLSTVVFLSEQGGVAIENVLLHEEAQRLSLTDGLTGVWNRRFVQMQFRQMMASALRFQRPFSVLMLDLDNFKVVNDTYGHQRGDAVLVEFSQRVSRVLREIDTFGRYGGEEFICLLAETAEAGALATAEKVLDVIRADPFGAAGERPVRLTVSIGVASYPQHGDSFRSLLRSADQALYRAKQDGRNCARVAGGKSGLKLAT